MTRAVYCVNSWTRNRSALTSALTLNEAISSVERFGDQRIRHYSELRAFFQAVAVYLPTTDRDDLLLGDFGEVQIAFDGEWHPVILGTGYEHVYAVMSFLPVLARILGRTHDLQVMLSYSRSTIDGLADSNGTPSDSDYEVVFELPPESFWQAVNALFDSAEFSRHVEKAFQIMGCERCPAEMRHFFVYEEDCYPLYNTSILVHYYSILLSVATEEQIRDHIRLTIGELIESTFNFSSNSRSRFLVEPLAR